MFNVVELASADKVDFWMLTDEPFDKSRFSRKRIVETQGVHLKVPTPEDTILAKLRWIHESGGSEKHFNDAMRVYELQYRELDLGYLNTWAERLGLEDPWQSLR